MIIACPWTKNNIPQTGLTPQLKIVNAATDSLLATVSMTEYTSLPGTYYYDFTTYDTAINYLFQFNSLDAESDVQYVNCAGESIGVHEIEPDFTLDEAIRVILAMSAAKSSGGGTNTIKFRDMNDGKDRITATVDGNGNRLTVVIDKS